MAAPPAVSIPLVADYDADTLAASPVTAWAPAVGANTLTALAGEEPTLAADAINGHKAVVFDGVNDLLENTLFDQPLPWSCVIVFIPVIDNCYLYSSGNNSFPGGVRLRVGELRQEGYGGEVIDGTVPTGQWHVVTGVWSTVADSANVRLDGGAPGIGAFTPDRSRAGLKVGNESSDVNRFPLNGSITRMLFYDGAFTAQDIIDLDTWVQDTYDIPVADYDYSTTPFSDDFADGVIDPRWIEADPQQANADNTTWAESGGSVTATSAHFKDAFNGPAGNPRLLQPHNNTDFDIAAKWAIPNPTSIGCGLWVDDGTNEQYIRWDLRDGLGRTFIADRVGGVYTQRNNTNISGAPTSFVWLRMTKVGTTYTCYRRVPDDDSGAWIQQLQFTSAVPANRIGIEVVAGSVAGSASCLEFVDLLGAGGGGPEPQVTELPRLILQTTPRQPTAASGLVTRELPRLVMGVAPRVVDRVPGLVARELPHQPLTVTPQDVDRSPGLMSRTLPHQLLNMSILPLVTEGGPLTTILPRLNLNITPRGLNRTPGGADRELPRLVMGIAPRPLTKEPGLVARVLPYLLLVTQVRDVVASLLKPVPDVQDPRAEFSQPQAGATIAPSIPKADFG